MSFVSLNDISGCHMSKALLVRRADALKDRIEIHKRELSRLRGELELRGLAAGSIRLQPQLITNEIGLLRRAIAKDLRQLSRAEALIGQCRDAGEDASESLAFSIVDPFRGKLISAEERGLGDAKRGDAAQKHFGGLPSKHKQKAAEARSRGAGMGEALEHNEGFIALDEGEIGEISMELRPSVVPEQVITAQEPHEDAWKINPVIEESGDMADQSPDGDSYGYDGLSGGATHAFDYVMPGGGGSNGASTGLADSVDAGGVEPFVDVQSQDFSLDDGGAVSGDLVEPGTIPVETSNRERSPTPATHDSREIVRGRRSIANATRFQPGNGPAAMEPMRGPDSPNGVPGGPSRLDAHRELMRRQLAGAGMGQAPAADQPTSGFDIASRLLAKVGDVGTAVIESRAGGRTKQEMEAQQARERAQESAASRYMPLLVIGGLGLVAFGAWMIFGGKKPAAEAAPKPVLANRKKRRAKKAKAC